MSFKKGTLPKYVREKMSQAKKGSIFWNKDKKGLQISWRKGKTEKLNKLESKYSMNIKDLFWYWYYDQNKSRSEMAKILNISQGYIQKLFKDYGFQMRSRLEAMKKIPWNKDKKTGKYIICENCGKEIYRPISRMKNKKFYFCNFSCYSEWRLNKGSKYRKTGKYLNCATCNTMIYLPKNKLKRDNNHFCSKDCYSKWQSVNEVGANNNGYKGGKLVGCSNCGKKIYKSPSRLNRYKQCFCSGECYYKWMNGSNSNGWQGGISFEPYSIEFNNQLKELIRQRDNYICQLCEIDQNGRKLDVHHIDYDKKNCLPSNLIALCNSCNSKVNANRQKWTKYFQEMIKTKEVDDYGPVPITISCTT